MHEPPSVYTGPMYTHRNRFIFSLSSVLFDVNPTTLAGSNLLKLHDLPRKEWDKAVKRIPDFVRDIRSSLSPIHYFKIRKSLSRITLISSTWIPSLVIILVGQKSNFSAPIRNNSSREFGKKTSFLALSPFSGQLSVTLAAGNSSLLVWLLGDAIDESFLSEN